MKYQCPYCKNIISADDIFLGYCPNCKKILDMSIVEKIEEEKISLESKSQEIYSLTSETTFPLTFYGKNKAFIIELRNTLDEKFNRGLLEISQSILPIIMQGDLHCIQIEKYIKEYKPKYFNKIEELKKSSIEWISSSEKDKEDLLLEFKEKSIDALEIKPQICDIEPLFEVEHEDLEIGKKMVEKFGYESFNVYFRHINQLKKVFNIPANGYERKDFEKLVEAGLAKRGYDIPLENILETFTLKEMEELIIDIDQKSQFKRKKETIQFLLSLPDIKERVSKKIAYRQLFMLNSLPDKYADIELDKFSKFFNFFNSVSILIAHTYYTGVITYKNLLDRINSGISIKGWEISSDENSCPYCKQFSLKTYPPKHPPVVPLHIGCRCILLPT